MTLEVVTLRLGLSITNPYWVYDLLGLFFTVMCTRGASNPTQVAVLEIVEDKKNRLVEPLGSSRVTNSTRITDSLDYHMNSHLIPIDVWEKYFLYAKKMNLASKWSSYGDNCQVLKMMT